MATLTPSQQAAEAFKEKVEERLNVFDTNFKPNGQPGVNQYWDQLEVVLLTMK